MPLSKKKMLYYCILILKPLSLLNLLKLNKTINFKSYRSSETSPKTT